MQTLSITFRRVFKYSLLFLTAIIILVFLFIWFLTLPPGEKILKSQLEGQIKQYINLDIKIGSLETDLLSRLELSSIVVSDSGNGTDKDLIHIKNIFIKYNIRDILNDRLRIDSLAIDSARICLERDSIGNYNMDFLNSLFAGKSAAENEEPSGFNIELARATIDNSEFYYRDAGLLTSFELYDIDIDVTSSKDSSYKGSMSIGKINTRYDTLPVIQSELKLTGRMQNSIISLDNLLWNIDNQLVLSGNTSLALAGDSTITAEIKATGNVASLYDKFRKYYNLPDLILTDDLALDLAASGSISNPEIRLICQFPDILFKDVAVRGGYAQAEYHRDTLIFDSLACRAFDGALSSSGRFVLDSTINTSVKINFSRIDFAKFWSAVYEDSSPYRGTLNGGLSLDGSGLDYSTYIMQTDVRLSQLSYEKQSLPDIDVSAIYLNNNLSLDVNHELFKVKADVFINDSSLDGTYRVDIAEIESLAGMFNITDLSGNINLSGDISGTVDRPRLKAEAVVRHAKYKNIPIDTLYVLATYDNPGLSVSDAFFQGAMETHGSKTSPFFIDSLFGKAAYRGSVKGTPGNLTGVIDLSIESAGYLQYYLDSLNSSMILDGPNVIIDSSNLFIDDLWVKINGIFNIQDYLGSLDMQLFSKDKALQSDTLPNDADHSTGILSKTGMIKTKCDLKDSTNYTLDIAGEDIDLFPIINHFNDSLDFNGTLDFELNFNGTKNKPAIKVAGIVTGLLIDSISLDSVRTKINILNDRIDLNELSLFGFGQKLQATGSAELEPDSAMIYRIKKQGNMTGQLVADNFDLSIINPFLPYSYETAGQLSADLKLSGCYSTPSWSGSLELNDGLVSLGPESQTVKNIKLDAEVYDTSLIIKSCTGTIDQYPFDIKGSLLLLELSNIKADLTADFESFGRIIAKGLISQKNMDMDISLETLDLSVFQNMIPQIDRLKGLAGSNIRITGKPADPEINGNLSIERLTFKEKYIPSEFSNGKVNLRFNKDNIKIDSTFISLGGGIISINGHISHDLAQLTDIDLKFIANNIVLNEPEEYQLHIQSVAIQYTKQGESFLLDGDIELGESRLFHGFKPQAILPWAKSAEQTQRELPSFLMQTNMNIRIRESDKLWIDNNLAKTRLRADLGLIGNPYRPNLNGRVKFEEGYFLYLDRKFKIENGDIYFYDPAKFNPEINLLARTNITAYQGMQSVPYTVTFSAEGLLDELKVGLSSEPPLEKSDIISLLTLGSTRSQLAGKDSGTRGVLTERAQMLTSHRISSYISKRAGSFLGLDEMSVEGNLFQSYRNGGPQVTAAKQLTTKAKITYSTTVGHSNDQSIRIDYFLSKHYSLLGQTDRAGNSSIDLKYSVRFK